MSDYSTFTPLIASAIFYASNGDTHISYIDALFNCVSAVTVCGLATVDLSSLTAWQQVILFLLMCMGSPVVVSWVMVYVRREIFASNFQHVVETEIARRVANKVQEPVQVNLVPWWKRAVRMLVSPNLSTVPEESHSSENTSHDREQRDREKEKEREKGRSVASKLRTDMIRRMDDAPKLVNPSGYISEGHSPHVSTDAIPRTQVRTDEAREQFESALQSVYEESERGAQRHLESDTESEGSIAREKYVILHHTLVLSDPLQTRTKRACARLWQFSTSAWCASLCHWEGNI